MKRISSIPPRTSIGIGLRGQGFNRRMEAAHEEYKVRTYDGEKSSSHKKPVPKKRPLKLKVSGASESLLDAFEESENTIKIVGEFPGIIDNMEGLVIDMEGNKLSITNKLNSIQQYRSVVDLPEDFAGAGIERCEANNGIITILLKKGA